MQNTIDPTSGGYRCDSEKTHDEECWWDALDATCEDGDDVECPRQAHIERAAAWRSEHCARR